MEAVRGSFRDPGGFVFTADGVIYRQVNRAFADEFDACVASGLYDHLAAERLLVPHRTVGLQRALTPDAHAVLEPERIEFVSYPYEWAFGQLKDAALLTLEAQERALARGFSLRDASAYNVQFHNGRPILIDTLSFGRYHEGEPWAAYKQFCEHFVTPLALMSMRDIRCGRLQREYLDGLPVDLGSILLPRRTWAKLGLLLHVHLHARASRTYRESSVARVTRGRAVSQRDLFRLIDNLRSTVEQLRWRPAGTQWADYTSHHNYTEAGLAAKQRLVRELVAQVSPRVIWDLGGNTGMFSRIARTVAGLAVCFDVDPGAVELNYRQMRDDAETGILPLQLDVMNPSPAQGWGHQERLSLEARGPADTVLALALIHHLAIANNLPLPRVAELLARWGRTLVIEFVPKADAQVQRLLQNRPDIFPGYTQEQFEQAFAQQYTIVARERVGESQRFLYLMQRR
jgi:ribosomal protein L11 methylase PrmA